MSQDPRVLVLVLDWIADTLRRWGVTFAEVEEMTRRGATDTRAVSDALGVEALQAQELAEDLQQRAVRVRARAALAESAGRDAIGAAADATNRAEATCAEALDAVHSWRGGLDRARARLAAAERELAAALSALHVAQSALAAAHAEHASAEAAYSSCRQSYTTDREGRRHYRSCAGEAARVSQAAAAVSRAQAGVDLATARVTEARNEVAIAQDLVARCVVGLGRAEGLHAEAQETLNQARSAGSLAHESLAIAEEAVQHSDLALTAAHSAVAAAGHAVASATALSEVSVSATGHANVVTDSLTTQQDLHVQGIAALERAEDDLRQFDAPSGL